jgi:threonine dehydrogenase-like Zn-dependent dehydrogenase
MLERELVLTGPKQIGYISYQEKEPRGNEVLVRTTVSGIKQGTEINLYRGANPFAKEIFDPVLRLFRPPQDGEQVAPWYPHRLGSWAVGVVEAVGPDVQRFKPGDVVHGPWSHRTGIIISEGRIFPVAPDVDRETMLFTDPGLFALASTHDAEIKLGDRVAIFGLGAIGLLAVQMAKLSGAAQVFAVDMIPSRLALAKELGADVAVNAAQGDTAISIKEMTNKAGVDVAVEISGAYSALQQAIRCVHREGLVVTTSYYGDTKGRVDLSREWHHNRITLRSSMPVWDNAHRWQPMWNRERLTRTAISMLEQGRLNVKRLIGARYAFDLAPEAYAMIDERPDESVKTLLTYSGNAH